MSNVKSMERAERIYKILLQFPKGISAVEIARKEKVQRTTVYDDLNSLKLQQKAENKEGLWFPHAVSISKPSRRGFWSSFSNFLHTMSEDKRLERERRIKVIKDDIKRIKLEHQKQADQDESLEPCVTKV